MIRTMNPPGRFLSKNRGTVGMWFDIGDRKAIRKVYTLSRKIQKHASRTTEEKIQDSLNQFNSLYNVIRYSVFGLGR